MRILLLNIDLYIKQCFINCRILYKLGCIITRWSWETVWECALPPFFFQGLCNQGKAGLFSNLMPGFLFNVDATAYLSLLPVLRDICIQTIIIL